MFKKANNNNKSKIPKDIDHTKYYRIFADFQYLKKKNYKVIKEIGRGGYGVVYKAEYLVDSNKACAIKIPFETILREQIAIEIRILMLAHNKNHIAVFRQVIEQRNSFHLVLDYYPHHSFINFFSQISLSEVAHYLYELLLGLKQLKQIGVLHRDIKPANFLYNRETKRGKIIDFGLAEVDESYVQKLKQYQSQLQEENDPKFTEMTSLLDHYNSILKYLGPVGKLKMGTESYMPLQSMLMIENQSYSSDIWPVGVIMLQCATRRYSFFNQLNLHFEGANNYKDNQLIVFLIQLSTIFGKQKVLEQMKNMDYACQLTLKIAKIDLKELCVIEGFNNIAMDLLTKLLDLNYKTRISVENALNHEFFDDIRMMHDQPNFSHQPFGPKIK